MKSIRSFVFTLLLLCVSLGLCAQQQEHPCLILTRQAVEQIRPRLGTLPVFDHTVAEMQRNIDRIMEQPVDLPRPRDAGGGYSHEQHKRNYTSIYQAGVLYQLMGDKKYAEYVKKMLFAYAELYPTLPPHPVQISNYRGRLFWQGLNESVWLVNVSQGYDCVYSYLTPEEREKIEADLFRPMIRFFREENRKTFARIHNHGTWVVAAVGMISYVMGDTDTVEQALYGPDKDGKGGFMKQIDQLFSPDGYFEEGPYYQRYSLQPFLMFAQAVDNNEPERKIFEYKDGVLLKAVTTLLQLTERNGQFFHLNDALDKTWHTNELAWGVDIAYAKTGNKQLLSIARQQGSVVISEAGWKVAQDIDLAEPFVHRTLIVRDGPEGDQGGIGVLRDGKGKEEVAVVMKYTSHGMGHGHFDKLSVSYYDNDREILQDYGAARFLNIEPKNGGHYLPENDSFCKQTISHNTLTVDGKSHFNYDMKVSSNHAPDFYAFMDTEEVKMVSAKERNAVHGVEMHRTVWLIRHPLFARPLTVDIFRTTAAEKHRYDLPFYYLGHLIRTSYPYEAFTTQRSLLGEAHGYQHLWVEAKGKAENNLAATTFLNGNRFYTISSLANEQTEVYLNRIGGTDPDFNLRNEPSVMLRQPDADSHTFVNVIEIHGDYNPRMEYTRDPYPSVASIRLLSDTEAYTVAEIGTKEGKTLRIYLSNNDNDPETTHTFEGYSWKGVCRVH
ncbi:MAG: alginate lyase family protein [Bacteroides sp.]|nr:alginate lyase family protein [Bacteroides sp.]